MGLNRISMLVFVAVVSALLTYFVLHLNGGGRCDVRPEISQAGLSAIHNNAERARTTAYNSVFSEKHDRDAANRAAEEAGMDSFVYDLKDAVSAEYYRHRRALDGCF